MYFIRYGISILLNQTFILFFLVMLRFSTLQCRVFAKALHYKEMEFEVPRSRRMDANPVAVVEALIHINNQLHQHEVHYLTSTTSPSWLCVILDCLGFVGIGCCRHIDLCSTTS